MWQIIVVIIIVSAAFYFAIRALIRRIKGKSKEWDCSSGCEGCPHNMRDEL